MRLRTKVLATLLVVQTALVLGMALMQRANLAAYHEDQLADYAEQLAQTAVAALKNPLLGSDAASVQQTLAHLAQRPYVGYVRVYRDEALFAKTDTPAAMHALHAVTSPILVKMRAVGRVELGVSRRFVTDKLNRALGEIAIIGALSLGAAWLFGFALMRGFTDRVVHLRQAVQAVAQGKLGWRVDVRGSDEIAETAKAFNLMSANLERAESERDRAQSEIGQIQHDIEARLQLRKTYSLATRSRLEHETLTDRVTQLPLQLLFRERLTQAMGKKQALVLLLVDISDLRVLSQALGHGVTDRLLAEMAQRLRATWPDAVLGRPGADEFALTVNVAAGNPVAIAERVLDVLRAPFMLLDAPYVPKLRVTAALSQGCPDAETLLDHAYSMLGTVSGEDIQVYDPAAAGSSRRIPPDELTNAMRNREIALCYQPRVDPNDYRLLGLQATLRWDHPARGTLAADAFLPLARQAGLAGALTRYSIEQALADRQNGRLGDLCDVPISIEADELSAQDARFADMVEELLMRLHAPPHALEIAFTERALTASPAEIVRNIRALKRLGVRVAVEDFGVGYTWLSYLNQERVQVDALRIDRSLVHEARMTDANIGLVKSVTDFARRLGIQTVAEGIESETLLSYVAVFGCDAVSGYHIQRPMTAEELRTWRNSQS